MDKHIIIESTLWSLAFTAGVLWCVQPGNPYMSHPDQNPTGGTENQLRVTERPLVITHEAHDGQIITHLPTTLNADSHRLLALSICDHVRQVARAFKVDEIDVWEWVEKERRNPTMDLRSPS